ncbi:UNVERIFIED_CONTAM: hypothetical protein RMT77_011013 [Armadillidium vulgare]
MYYYKFFFFVFFVTTIHLTFQTETCGKKAKEISFAELKSGVENGKITVLDVRARGDLVVEGAIPKSINVPFSELEDAFSLNDEDFVRKYGSAKPKAENLVISCAVGAIALRAWRLLNKFGYCNSRVYYGSFNDWVNNKGPIVKPGKKTKRR